MTGARTVFWARLRNVVPDLPAEFTPGMVRCPCHEDRKASFWVGYEGGRVRYKCHAGCEQAVILKRLGLSWADLFDETPYGEILATYVYVDERGMPLFRKLRREGKKFQFQHQDPTTGEWIYGRGKAPHTLYRLPRVRQAIAAGELLWVVEGEKDAETLEANGEYATCNPRGAAEWRQEYTEQLRGAKVRIVCDNDAAGIAHGRAIWQALQGVASPVELVRGQVNRKGADATDHFNEGGATDDFIPLDPGEQTAAEGEPLPKVERSEGAAILDEVEHVYRRYVAWSNEHQAVAVTLWTGHTHAADSSDTTPYLDISSAEPESGKTRTLEVAEQLTARAWMLIEPSEAAMFRKIERDKPTLLLDEVDALWGRKADGREGLRALLNAGYRRGATVPRCVGEGTGMTVQDFPVYGPKALAGLAGKLPRTIVSRSIPIRLRRRAKAEPVERFRLGRATAELEPIRLRLAAWVQLVNPELEAADPEIPGALSDRQADSWQALLSIADAAGGDWPKRARAAAIELHGHDPAADPSIGVLLLGHVLEAFMDAKADRLPTAQLLNRLVDREDAPWAEWWAHDVEKGETKGPAAKLAKLLKPYGVKPKVLDFGGGKARGYELEAFDEAATRYLPPDPVSERNDVSSQVSGHIDTLPADDRVTSPQASDQQGYGVTSENGGEGVGAAPEGEAKHPEDGTTGPHGKPWPSREDWAHNERTFYVDIEDSVRDGVSQQAADYATPDEIETAAKAMLTLRNQLLRDLRQAKQEAGDALDRPGEDVVEYQHRYYRLTDEQQAQVGKVQTIEDRRKNLFQAAKALRGGHLPGAYYLHHAGELPPDADAITARYGAAVDAKVDEVRQRIETAPIDDDAWQEELERRAEVRRWLATDHIEVRR